MAVLAIPRDHAFIVAPEKSEAFLKEMEKHKGNKERTMKRLEKCGGAVKWEKKR